MTILLSELLKGETENDHNELDQLPLLSQMMSPAISLALYQQILERMHACFSESETAIANRGGESFFSDWFYEPKLSYLKEDLSFFNLLPKREASDHAKPLVLNSADEALGALYVLFGSSLGGSFIAKHLQKNLQLTPETGLAFYSSCTESLKLWRSFKEKLNSSENHSLYSPSEVLSGAKKAFEVFKQCFRSH